MRVKKTYIKEEHKMSTNRTPIYNLCQWKPEDPVKRTDFNEDNAKLDAALAEMENLGLSQLISYQNELFQANKAKLGLTFAYPGNR